MYRKITEFQNMMINIIENGDKEVWQSIEEEKNPLERCRKRKLYSDVIDTIGEETEIDTYE